MDVGGLADRTFGPYPLRVTVDAVSDFVEVTGNDPDRWVDAAPPGFVSAALFVVAPELLGQLSDRSVIHGEQSFTWHSPICIGTELAVSGTVTRVRERGGIHFVGFDIEVSEGGSLVAEGSSLFLVSGDASVVNLAERPEPEQDSRGALAEGQRAASRADLVRYAAATRDWNPVHWDHASAVAAGLPGVVVHGLFQASWAFVAAAEGRHDEAPLARARVRFRNPLLPANPVDVAVSHNESTTTVSVADADSEYLSARIELADG